MIHKYICLDCKNLEDYFLEELGVTTKTMQSHDDLPLYNRPVFNDFQRSCPKCGGTNLALVGRDEELNMEEEKEFLGIVQEIERIVREDDN